MLPTLSFENQTVVVTGVGGSLGKAYAFFFAARGANVVVSEYGNRQVVDDVVQAIKAVGGKVVGAYDTDDHANKIIEAAIAVFGRIDILINHSEVTRDIPFENMTDADWNLIYDAHVKAAFKCTRTAWPFFKRQKYGRVLCTASPAGLYGSSEQCNYSASQLALIGFTETLAREGAKYNILANVVSPIATSRAAAHLPNDVRRTLTPESVAPLVALLSHPSNKESASIFEAGGGHIAKLRWERASGALLRADQTLIPGAILHRWNEVNDFQKPQFPDRGAGIWDKLQAALRLPPNHPGEDIRFDGKIALVTGGGAGIGRAYCLMFASLGASVVVNDLVNPDTVVGEIRQLGGKAVPNKASVDDGEAVIGTAIQHFGRIDILVNNAGILRDKAIANMSDKDWDDVTATHLRGTYKCARAAYPYMMKQGYGRIINTSSTSGIYGNFGQTNYASAKAGILGFSRALAVEGYKHNIYVNNIAPTAGTQLTSTVMPEKVVQALKPDYIASLVVLLCSDMVPKPATGLLFEVGGGFQAQTRWQRSGGHTFPSNQITPEQVLEQWPRIVDFDDGRADHPRSLADGLKRLQENGNDNQETSSFNSSSDINGALIRHIEPTKTASIEGIPYTWTEKDAILYNISLGARSTQLNLTYEGDPNFRVLPTYGVIPQFKAKAAFKYAELLPNFNLARLLHGEQYIEICKFPIPTAANVISYPRLLQVVDKGNAAVVYTSITTKDAQTGEGLFYSESASFVRGSGGFGGQKKASDRGDATAVSQAPDRSPDALVEEKTSPDQAALYRLNGDTNPLHIDPAVSRKGGFEKPILHGLCTFGFCGKHILQSFGQFKSIKARFSGVVLSGQTLITEMWKEHDRIIFQTRIKETGKLCIAGGGARLMDSGGAKL
ncbi:hypothetical protein AJ80_03659 [Polytolypa hystricis UAMH7299]|uniref:Ketoreductase domain-containing protein n=1 Tax=Polytolypa hystricis (strain UAMH7299) TaxID=1447883 RepID=A0A2B7YGD3_POLH7|nr:hypothetical protein AJ80_03659 [Polytolypa hystricis UAMH7299]